MDNHLQNELDRATIKGVTSIITEEPRNAFQCPQKSEAVRYSKLCGWGSSAPIRVEIMGFYVWVISDPHLNYLTARGVLRQINERKAMGLIKEV